MMALMTRLRWIVAGLVAPLLTGAAHAQAAPSIAAAADLRVALTEVAAAFKRDTAMEVRLTFGSSGNFYQQLSQGAPFELFLSADEHYALDLAKAGKTRDPGTIYAIGRLALVAPKGSALAVDSRLAGLRAALAQGRIERFAIANPDHAPYGARAREALQHERLWTPIADKIVIGENVAQAFQFATAGGAQGGIVSYALVFDPGVKARINFAVLPDGWHQPIRQRMVLMRGAGPVAQRFYLYLQQPAARRILVRYGFLLPAAR